MTTNVAGQTSRALLQALSTTAAALRSDTGTGQGGLPLGMGELLFLHLREGLVVTDPAGRIISANPAFCSMSGYALDELAGQNMSRLSSGRQDEAFYKRFWQTLWEEGWWQGEIWNRRRDGELIAQWLSVGTVYDAEGAVLAYVAALVDISHSKQSQLELERLALHDALTGLPNRARFNSVLAQSLARSQRHGGQLALMMLDLDGFKQVNDSLGHPVGDRLLCAVARRLQQRLRQTDLIARLGGDEFVVLLEGAPQHGSRQARDIAAVAEALVGAMIEPFDLATTQLVRVGVSIGISLHPQDGQSAEQLLQHADAALYQAKSAGRGTFRFYTDALTRAARARLEREQQLRAAIASGALALHFQPRFEMDSMTLHSVEALIRWTDPQGEPQRAAELIELAQQAGLMVALSDWVLAQSCTAMRRWLTVGVAPPCLTVNVTPQEFARDDLPARVQQALGTDLAPQRLELELTEEALARVPDAAERLGRLKALGVRLALSHFGAGPSSLATLVHCPFDTLKLDSQLVHAIGTDDGGGVQSLAEAAIRLGHSLGWQVGAERIETAAQHAGLCRQGCDLGQGWLYARPMPEFELLPLLRQRSLPQPA